MTTDAFGKSVTDWITTAKDKRFDCHYTECTYQPMLEYTTIDNPRPSFGLIVHHTDAEREYAYDANPKSSGKLVTALEAAPKNGWTVVDMKEDWATVFPAN